MNRRHPHTTGISSLRDSWIEREEEIRPIFVNNRFNKKKMFFFTELFDSRNPIVVGLPVGIISTTNEFISLELLQRIKIRNCTILEDYLLKNVVHSKLQKVEGFFNVHNIMKQKARKKKKCGYTFLFKMHLFRQKLLVRFEQLEEYERYLRSSLGFWKPICEHNAVLDALKKHINLDIILLIEQFAGIL